MDAYQWGLLVGLVGGAAFFYFAFFAKGGAIGSLSRANPAEVASLRQNLRLKVMYDEEKIDRLVAMERELAPGAGEVAWYRAAIERWERDNR